MADAVAGSRVASAGTVPAPSMEPTVLFRIVNRVAIISLNRPSALNALSHEMILELTRLFDRCRTDERIVALVLRSTSEKAFCAGGDVRALHGMVTRGEPAWLQFFVDEYRLDYAIHTFPKPVVALLDGITMGGGMGLGQGARLRVVTNRTKMAMPETRIGLFPDVGATHFLSKMPVELALYVGLTGTTLSGPEALLCQLADVCVAADWLATFEERLQRIPVFGGQEKLLLALRAVFEPPCNVVPHAALNEFLPTVMRYFNERSSVESIVATLNNAMGREASREVQQWLESTSKALTTRSPTMLKVTREALLRGRRMTLADCFRMELDIMSRAVPDGDFLEGVRAHLIDKDGQPRWLSPTLDEVKEESVRHFYSTRWRAENHPLADLDRA